MVPVKVAAVVFLLAAVSVRQGLQQEQCSVDRLPDFGDRTNNKPNHDRFQAIVPAYRFNCSGRVVEWGACVHPGGSEDEQYYIQFQVWRPTGTEGCYELVGYNEPPVEDTQDESGRRGSRSTTTTGSEYGILSPVDHCVVLTVRESERIDFQPGDVVGYYVDRLRDRSNGGIQSIDDSDVVVYYKAGLSRQDIKSQYALNGPHPTECGFPVSDSNSYTLSDSSTSAPIISIRLATTVLPNPPPSPPLRVMSSTPTGPSILVTPSPLAGTTPGITTAAPSASIPPAAERLPSSSTPPAAERIPSGSTSTTAETIGIIVGVVLLVLLFILVIAVGVIIIAVYVKRNRKEKVAVFLNNPYYHDVAVPLVTSIKSSTSTSTLPAPYYDYCRIPAENGANTQSEERVYATIQSPLRLTQGDIDETQISEHNDYTVIYEDPTSPSYVSEVYSTGSVFDTVGTYVQTLEERTRYQMPESASDDHQYNALQFFERDQVFWAPASTTSGLYEQLCTKRYREISRKQIRVLEQLGSGQFGTVSKGVWTYNRESMRVAVKALKSGASETDRVKFLQEAAIMGQFYHPNIVRLHGVVTVGEPVLIVLDFMPNGDMKSYLDHLVVRREDQTRLLSQFLKYGREIAAGMAYLAKKSFIHRDLAARNVLLDQHMSCKVGDFGMARDLVGDTYYKSRGGQIPVKWTAPEALLYKKYSTASDVWSYAMVLYEIWSVGKKPFQDLSNSDVIARLQNHQCLSPPPGCPREVYSLMVDCWNPEPSQRPTFEVAFRVLRRPEELLLHWSEEDVAAGRHLLQTTHTTHSFSDLQNKYIPPMDD